EMRATPFVPCPDAIPSSNPDCGPAKLVVTARGRCRRRVAGLAGMALLHDPGLCAGRIAQLVEQLTLNQRVPGSSPGAPTTSPSNTASGTTSWEAHPVRFPNAHLRGVTRDRNELVLADPHQSRELRANALFSPRQAP